MTTISAVIPTMNRRPFLSRAIESIFTQTILPTEIIVADDGSTDNTNTLIETIQNKLVPLRYSYAEHRGNGAARNRGLGLAVSPIVAFLDSDDTWTPQHLENLTSAFRAFPEASVASASYELVGASHVLTEVEIDAKYRRRNQVLSCSTQRQGTLHLLDPNSCLHELLRGTLGFSTSTLAIHRHRTSRAFAFDEQLLAAPDNDLRLQFFAAQEKMAYVDEVGSRYYFHMDNLVSTPTQTLNRRIERMLNYRHTAAKMLMYCRDPADYAAAREHLADSLYILSCLLHAARQHESALAFAVEASYYTSRRDIKRHALLRRILGLRTLQRLSSVASTFRRPFSNQ